MEKLANVAFVLQCDGVEDRVKVAAVTNYITSIDSLDTDEEKIAALEELESLLKEANIWQSIAPKLMSWGSKWAGKGPMRDMVSGWLQRAGTGAFKRGWEPVGKGIAAGIGGAAGKAATGVAGKSGLLNWMAAHPMAGKLGLGGAVAGGSLLGGSIYGGMKSNDAYKRGYGTAVSQLSPMVSAMYAPQGAMSLPPHSMRA